MRTYLFTLLIYALMSPTLMAQSKPEALITGKVLDQKGEAIPFANVRLSRFGSTEIMKATNSGMDGSFSLILEETGSFSIRISYIGFEEFNSETILIESLPLRKDLGNIILKEDAVQLESVEVKGARPQLIQETDKLVMDVENSALATGATAMEVLERVPGIFVDQDGNITLNGQTGVRVMIDGRPTYLSPKELDTYLRAMSADNIKNIEIITNPSAKYDAEGTAGIIDIKLKKNTIVGLNGSINLSEGYNGMANRSWGTNLNYKKGKMASFFSFDRNERGRPRELELSRRFENSPSIFGIRQDAELNEQSTSYSFRTGADIDLNDRHSIGAMLRYVDTNAPLTLNSNVSLLSHLMDGQTVESVNRVKELFSQRSVNLHYNWKTDTLGSQFSVDMDYSDMASDTDSQFRNRFFVNGVNMGPDERLASINPRGYSIYAARADYTHKLKGNRLFEVGAKYSHVTSDNDFIFSISEGESWVIDPLRSNHFVYTEDILAAYGNFKTPLGDRFQLQTGLRMEQTRAEGYSITLDLRTPRNYTDFFPSVFLSQKVSNQYTINYNYSRRIFRPPYGMLNPFMIYADPFTAIEGNPYLLPSYINSYEITQVYKGMYNLSLSYQRSSNTINEVPFQDDENQFTTFMQTNLDNVHTYMGRLMVPIEVNQWWSMNNFALLIYQQFDAELSQYRVQNSMLTLQLQNQQTLTLPGGWKLELTAMGRGPAYMGVYKIDSQWWVDMGLRKSLAKEKLDLTFNATDIFRSRMTYISTDFQGQETKIQSYDGFQGVRLSLRYKFSRGEGFQVRNRRLSSQEEIERAGG